MAPRLASHGHPSTHSYVQLLRATRDPGTAYTQDSNQQGFPSGLEDEEQAGALGCPEKVRKDSEQILWSQKMGWDREAKNYQHLLKGTKDTSKLNHPPQRKQGPGSVTRTWSCCLALPITPRRHLETPVLMLRRNRAGKWE